MVETAVESEHEDNRDIPLLRSGTAGPFTRMPLSVLLPAGAVGAISATALVAAQQSLWTALGAGFGIAVLGMLRRRGRNVWRILGSRIALGWRNRRRSGKGLLPEPFDVPIPESGGEHCGMCWDGIHLVTMLAVEATVVAPVLLKPSEFGAARTVPLAAAAKCLGQFDVRLAAIDVVTAGMRTRGPVAVADVYERLLGPLPAAASRSVWLVLRFDPLANVEAIENRGGGETGTVRTALVATRRVTGRLRAEGVEIRMLTAAELAGASASLRHDIAPDRWSESWQAVRHDEIRMSGYTVPPGRLDTAVLAGVWTVPGLSTVVRLRLTPAGGPGPVGAVDPTGGTIAVSTVIRHDTDGSSRAAAGGKQLGELGLRPMSGVQRRVLIDDGDPGAGTAAIGTPAALERICLPVDGCGQVIGATADGCGVAVPLFGSRVRRVEIAGGLRLVQQMVLRAVAVGAKVVVHSVRAPEWAHFAAQVGDPEVLVVAVPGAGARHAAVATLIVYDGVVTAGQVSEGTVLRVRNRGEITTAPADVDVALIESEQEPGLVRVYTAGGRLEVRVVSIPEELRYLDSAPTPPETAAPDTVPVQAPTAESAAEAPIPEEADQRLFEAEFPTTATELQTT